MTTNIQLTASTPSETWDTLIGSQTPAQFVTLLGDDETAEEAFREVCWCVYRDERGDVALWDTEEVQADVRRAVAHLMEYAEI